MRRFPLCPCQLGTHEFNWEAVLYGGPHLGGYEVSVALTVAVVRTC